MATTEDESGRHYADFSIQAGSKVMLKGSASITNGGLLAIGAMVSAILLSSAVIVVAAKRGGRVSASPSQRRLPEA